jgi:UDP-3-O-[3-hydroxymyristoyl] N-acetylglucosamine deacetylase
MRQQTIAESISCTGIGLHSGLPVQLSLRPARVGSGIVFVRTDLDPVVEIAVRSTSVSSTRYATTLRNGVATIGTVEHLLAALYGLEIDNLRVEVTGPELPILDGSAASYVYLIRSAGIFSQRESRKVLQVRKRIVVRDGARSISIEPARGLRISYAVDFSHPSIGRQEIQMEADPTQFEREISAARTFGFLNEVKGLWKSGFARGGSLDNAVVLDDHGVMNADGLRWPDEFVRHKVLDLFGDLATLGIRVQGHVRVERGGHSIHQKLVREILECKDRWRVYERGRLRRKSVDPAFALENA